MSQIAEKLYITVRRIALVAVIVGSVVGLYVAGGGWISNHMDEKVIGYAIVAFAWLPFLAIGWLRRWFHWLRN